MSDLFTAGSLHPSACNASGRDVASVHRCALARLASDGVPRAEYEFRGGRGDALASFQSDACSHFYDALAPRSRRIADPFVTTVSRSLVVTEDLHPGGRAFAIAQLQPAQEVMVSHDFKVGYVVVRKAASSSLSSFMADAFAANWHDWCADRPPSCRVYANDKKGRCTSRCLTRAEAESYFFFSFVVHPVDRFFKGFRQYRVMLGSRTSAMVPKPAAVLTAHRARAAAMAERPKQHAAALLRQVLDEQWFADHHFQTQAYALSTRDDALDALPIAFVGRVEAWATEAARLVAALEAHTRTKVGEAALRRLDPKARRNARKDDERALDCDGPTRRLAALAFAQDIVCLGYNASGAAWKCDRGVGGVSYESGGGAPWLPRAARPLGG